MAGSRRVVVVVGIPGVGKTTLVRRVEKLISGGSRSVRIASFGTEMLAEAAGQGVPDRDALRALPVSRQQELQRAAGERIAAMREDVVIVDTHAFISSPDGFYYPGLPARVLEAVRPDAFVTVSAKPEEIYSRRIGDKSRSRDTASVDKIKKELAVQDAMVSTCAVLSGSPMMPVLNSEGGADGAAAQVARAAGL